jgi:hypothetical protein
MADIASIFLLIAIMHGSNDAFTITELASFQSEAACNTAAETFSKAVANGGSKTVEVGCLPASAIEELKRR